MMTERALGATGIQVTRIGLGCWQFSGSGGLAGRYWPALPQEAVNGIVRASLEGGVRWFDTAEAYGAGNSEAALSAALQAAGRDDGSVVIATKWLPLLRTAGSIRKTIDDRLRELAPYSIDLHQIHIGYGSLSSKRAQVEAMARLVESGRIRAVGVSNFSARAMRLASRVLARHGLALASNQVRYSLLDRRLERNGVLAAARELGATIIAYSPLAQGLLSGKFHDDPERVKRLGGPRRLLRQFRPRGLRRSEPVVSMLKEVAAAHGALPAQAALRWLVQQDGVVAIPGASSPEQARQNAAALDFTLTDAEVDALERVSRAFL
ncbi:MAG TPA: aldo/keto reductase [Longimicrobiales bacterium]|nr:aldo/keto reductase [Longimicrobiales bacterium]